MKKILILYFLLTGMVLKAEAQATYFTFDSIWSPPYICQASDFNVEIFGMRSNMAVADSTQSYLFSNDTVFVNFHFTEMGGLMVPTPLHRQIFIPAPPIGQYKIVVRGYHKGQLHRTITSNLSVCSTIASTKAQLPEEFQIEVYPNPTSDFLWISIPGNSKDVSLVLTDATGKVCLRKKIPGTKVLKLDIRVFPKGVYFLKLETERGSIIKKIVKQ